MSKQIYVPNLPVFSAIKHAVLSNGKPYFENIAFICTQHELATTINLLETLIELGAKPDNIYLMGKYYSTCSAVVDKLIELGIHRQTSSIQEKLGEFANTFKADIAKMWEKFSKEASNKNIKGIIILDDGGRCLASAPKDFYSKYPIVGVEQTTGGIVNPDTVNLPFPIIEVASSAAKLWLESPIIATAAITDRLDGMLRARKDRPICGVIGTGYIGMAVIKKLVSLGYEVIGYDKNQSKACEFEGFSWGASLEDVIKRSRYIFGCTGYDITPSLDFDELIDDDKFFFSCSSEDREFLSLLKLVQQQNPVQQPNNLQIVYFYNKKGHVIEIFRGGFPITFDGSPQPAPAVDIQLTQGLLLCALVQAATMLPSSPEHNEKARVMLDPVIQQFVSSVWEKTQPPGRYADDLLNRFRDTRWIMDHSGGRHYPLTYISDCFGKLEYKKKVNTLLINEQAHITSATNKDFYRELTEG